MRGLQPAQQHLPCNSPLPCPSSLVTPAHPPLDLSAVPDGRFLCWLCHLLQRRRQRQRRRRSAGRGSSQRQRQAGCGRRCRFVLPGWWQAGGRLQVVRLEVDVRVCCSAVACRQAAAARAGLAIILGNLARRRPQWLCSWKLTPQTPGPPAATALPMCLPHSLMECTVIPFLPCLLPSHPRAAVDEGDDGEDSEEGGGRAARGGRASKKSKAAADAATVKACREKARREKLNEW